MIGKSVDDDNKVHLVEPGTREDPPPPVVIVTPPSKIVLVVVGIELSTLLKALAAIGADVRTAVD